MRVAATAVSLCASWAVCLLAMPCLAQTTDLREPLPEMQVLTVEEAVVQGLIHNPDLRAARHAIGLAEGEVISATLLSNPEISATYGREQVRERDKATHAVSHSHTSSWDFSIAQDISIAGARPIRVLQSRADLARAKADVAIQEIDLVRNIKHSIAEYMGNSVGVAELHNVVFGVKPLMWELTKDKPDDRHRCLMVYSDIQQETRNDRQERMEIESELNTWLGYPPRTRVMIKDSLEPEPVPLTYEELREVIMSRNLDVKSAMAVLRSARYSLKLAQQGRVPDLTGALNYVYARENTPSSIAHHHEWDEGLGITLNIFDQNQGGIWSAIANEAMARDALTATKWDVENELFKLYQDLNLTRVRIRAYQYGYLARLHEVIYEKDLVAYDEGKLEFATWDQDLKRYHVDGDDLLNLKIQYKKTLADLEFLAGGSFSAPPKLPDECPEPEGKPGSYMAGVGSKLSRGMGNMLFSPLEVPASVAGNVRDRGFWGVIVGPVDGALTFAERFCAGALDTVTFPIPWPLNGMEPVSEPVWDTNPWSGTWSLRYFHPALLDSQQRFHPAYQADISSLEMEEKP